ncbi:MAG: hypothetical protein HQL38_03170 [Alphaproteobacteria bacterium]|nr:hypothetical protein [Alphaproteobacteria bacterium]
MIFTIGKAFLTTLNDITRGPTPGVPMPAWKAVPAVVLALASRAINFVAICVGVFMLLVTFGSRYAPKTIEPAQVGINAWTVEQLGDSVIYGALHYLLPTFAIITVIFMGIAAFKRIPLTEAITRMRYRTILSAPHRGMSLQD